MAARKVIANPTKGRMFSVQADLPRLPVPPLHQTLDKYLQAVKPITSSDTYQHTEQVSLLPSL